MLVPVALCLLGHIDPSHFAGALAAEDDSPGTTPVTEMSREALQAELARLDTHRTAFIGPTVMAGSGGVVAIIGAVFLIYGAAISLLVGSSSSTTMMMLSGLQVAGYVVMGIGGALLLAGGIVLAIGLARLFPTLARRREAMERRDEVLKQLEATDPTKLPPPPTPGPGDVWLTVPRPSLVLATF